MDVRILPKPPRYLLETRLVHQSRLWARYKRRLGWSAMAFDIESGGVPAGDMLVVWRDVGGGASVAYVPYGPEGLPGDDERGAYLAALAECLRPFLPAGCLFVRWDLPWESPYALDPDRYDGDGHWLGAPETRVREARMNFGVRGGRLRKSPSDVLPPDTLIVDLTGDDDKLLSRMRPKTRYNVRLAERRGVRVRRGRASDLGAWNALYADTARRNGMTPHGGEYFSAIVASSGDGRPVAEPSEPGEAGEARGASGESVSMLLAEKDGEPLAAMFLTLSADGATYLYGASSSRDRQLMAPYALQWAAMREAKASGCASYDLFGVAPRPDPDHPLFGLYAFKSGFGGSMLHRQGSWDVAYDEPGYAAYAAMEAAGPGFTA